jgi:transposase
MIQITPQMRVRVCVEPVDFRAGIDGLRQRSKERFDEDPFSGTVFLFRNRKGTSIKILVYDGQGFWLCQKRLSEGRFRHWPRDEASSKELAAREIFVLLSNGDPFRSGIAGAWKKIDNRV